MQILLGANLSLEGIDTPGVTMVGAGPAWVSGGTFGSEAGLSATVVTLTALALLAAHLRRDDIRDLPVPLGLA